MTFFCYQQEIIFYTTCTMTLTRSICCSINFERNIFPSDTMSATRSSWDLENQLRAFSTICIIEKYFACRRHIASALSKNNFLFKSQLCRAHKYFRTCTVLKISENLKKLLHDNRPRITIYFSLDEGVSR